MTTLNNIQYREYQCAQQLASFLKKSKRIYSNVEPFRNEVTPFLHNLAQVSGQAGIKEQKGTGVTIQKRELKKQLAREAAGICTLATAFAITTNNTIFKHQVRFTYTDFFTLKECDVRTVITNLVKNIKPFLSDKRFAGYGITADNLTSVKKKALQFNDSIGMATMLNNRSDIASNSITSALKKIKGNIAQFTRLLPLFSSNHPGFITGFQDALVVTNTAVRHNGVEGIIKNSFTGQPVEGVTITSEDKKKTVVTSASGFYHLARIKTGNRKLTMSADGFTTQVITVKVIRGTTVTLNISLEARVCNVAETAVA